ncbi:CD63 antigen [Zeugodacus cucurbitae]|uniref:Tetraspanin n=1 Tax=Zeugodacus cucurbitae TaxID=28588 RepID=A0A0A1XA90_ZEUCU|nr:CD63 antigen [Zeugodacus cucurbitae]XP_011192840.1 CD63 antigen [Zeugodacus cucurbitae]XP_028900397.1 CD63 antigen [Zeugodacus cucurbitae]
MASGGLTCVKFITFFCNLLFALSGLLILIVGAMVQLNYAHYSNFVSNHIWTVPIILIIVGATIAFICFLGCCGALKENSCMILSFAILAVIIFLFEIGLGIAGYVKHASLSDIMEEQFNSTMKEYNERKENRDAWSLLQSEMDCCGTFGPKDWVPIFHNSSLPPACCAVINLNEAQDCTVVHAHSEGCLNKLLTLLDSKTLTLAGVVLGVAGIQLLTILFAFCLFRSFRRSYQTV